MAGRRNRALLLAPIVVAACGGIAGVSTTTNVEVTDATPAPTSTPTTSPQIADVPGARQAVVQIVAEGTFVDPVEGEVSGAGAGSGFIFDSGGLAVTNNHVVTGAALLRVYVDGEDEPRNARIVGVSECADLAVIDIDGEGFPALQWRTEPIQAGMQIFALGFPLGDPEYTVLDGVVAKESADGDTSWASVDSVIEHSADILGGNSGGPVVDESGRVVAISYAGNDAGQAFAIGGDVARRVVDRLAEGEDLDTIGINGQAFVSEDGQISGLWVASVSSGSSADRVGILAGDIITRIEGLVLARDGTMSDYCDILRTHEAGDALKVEVLRVDTEETLQGTLPDVPLTAVDETTVTGETSAAGEETYSSFGTLSDETGTLSVNVPTEWSDRLVTSWERDDEFLGPGLSAASDRDAFLSDWTSPGIFLGASRILFDEYGSAEAYLEAFEGYSSQCETVSRDSYDDGFYVGVYDLWEGCGSTGAALLQLVTVPLENQDHIVYLLAQMLTDSDWGALEEALATFTSTGDF